MSAASRARPTRHSSGKEGRHRGATWLGPGGLSRAYACACVASDGSYGSELVTEAAGAVSNSALAVLVTIRVNTLYHASVFSSMKWGS